MTTRWDGGMHWSRLGCGVGRRWPTSGTPEDALSTRALSLAQASNPVAHTAGEDVSRRAERPTPRERHHKRAGDSRSRNDHRPRAQALTGSRGGVTTTGPYVQCATRDSGARAVRRGNATSRLMLLIKQDDAARSKTGCVPPQTQIQNCNMNILELSNTSGRQNVIGCSSGGPKRSARERRRGGEEMPSLYRPSPRSASLRAVRLRSQGPEPPWPRSRAGSCEVPAAASPPLVPRRSLDDWPSSLLG